MRRGDAPPSGCHRLPGLRRGRRPAVVARDSTSTRRLDGAPPRRYSHAAMISERSVTVAVAPGVTLDARLALPPDPAGGVAICHPHPLHGGDMENPVVIRAAEVCQEAGLATIRFNFRGVGASTGAYDEGRGEQDDLGAALDHLAGLLPAGSPIAVAGYSFGAAVAGRVA